MTSRNILACYLRISDEDLDLKQNLLKDESSSISAQRKLIHDYIQSHDDLCRLEIHEFLDDGYSGTNFDRPSIQKIFELMTQGRIACIIVKDDCVILELNSESPENTGLCDVSSVF